MNTIESILNDIDELLEDSWSLPLSGGRCVVDAEKVRDLIDSIRMNMPAEIKQARAVVADRNQILSLAKGEAEALIRKAEERAKQLLEQESIVRQANAKAMALLNDAAPVPNSWWRMPKSRPSRRWMTLKLRQRRFGPRPAPAAGK